MKADSERENHYLPQVPWKGFFIQWILIFIEKNMISSDFIGIQYRRYIESFRYICDL